MRTRSLVLTLLLAVGTAPLLTSPSSAADSVGAPSVLSTVGMHRLGDGGPATQAHLTPLEAAGDAAGNIFVLEPTRVRRIDVATGTISAVAGSVYPAAPSEQTQEQPATAALVPLREAPTLAVSRAGTAVVDTVSRTVEVDGAVVRQLPPLADHYGVAFGPDGTLYYLQVPLSSTGGVRLRALPPGASLWQDLGMSDAPRYGRLAFAADGTMYAGVNGSVHRRDGSAWTLVAGGGSATAADGGEAVGARLDGSFAVLSSGTVVVEGTGGVGLYRIDNGTLRSLASPGSRLLGAVGSDALVAGGGRVWRVPVEGGPAVHVAGTATPSADGVALSDAPLSPHSLCRDSAGRLVLGEPDRVRGTDDQGRLTTRYVPPAASSIRDVTCGADGTVFALEVLLTDGRDSSQRVVAVASDGRTRVVAGGGSSDRTSSDGAPATSIALHSAVEVEVDTAGVVFVREYTHSGAPQRLYAVLPNGSWQRVPAFGPQPSGVDLALPHVASSLTVDTTTGRLLLNSTAGVFRLDADRAAFTRLTTLGARASAVLPDGTLALWDGAQFVRRYADGRTAVLAGGCPSFTCGYDDLTDPLQLRFDFETQHRDPTSILDVLPDAGGVAFLQRLDTGYPRPRVVLRRLVVGAEPVFPAAAPLSGSYTPAQQASITLSTAAAAPGDRVMVIAKPGTVASDSVYDGESFGSANLRDPNWQVAGNTQSITAPWSKPGTWTFTVFRRTPAGATSRGASVTIRVSGEYLPLTPSRLLDTRTTHGQIGYAGPQPTAGQTVTLNVADRDPSRIPADAAAVVLNVTATAASSGGYVSVYPCGQGRPLASTLNLKPGQARPNVVVTKMGSTSGVQGRVCLFTSADTHLVADVAGYFPAGSSYTGVTPERLLETRSTNQRGYTGSKPASGQTIVLDVTSGPTSTVPPDAKAVVLNVTSTAPDADGVVTVYPCGEARPLASNLNPVAGDTRPNLVVSGLGTGAHAGKVCLFTTASTHLIADITGFFPAASSYRGVTPERLLETRSTHQRGYTGGKPAGGQTIVLDVTSGPTSKVPANAAAVLLNVTSTQADSGGFVTVFPCGQARPSASNLNLNAGVTAPNLVISAPGTGAHAGKVCLYTSAPTHLVADVAGYVPAP